MTLSSTQMLAVLALLLTVLSLNVSRLRLKYRVSYGDEGHKDLTVAIRAHGNALEQCLLFAVLVLALEQQSATVANQVAWVGQAFVAARVVHAIAMLRRWLRLRQLAHVFSLLGQLAVALVLLQ